MWTYEGGGCVKFITIDDVDRSVEFLEFGRLLPLVHGRIL